MMSRDRMRRREFIAFVGGAAVAWPVTARAQQSDRMRRVGVLIPFAESDGVAQAEVAVFREALQKLDWGDGRNVRFDYRWAAGDAGRVRAFAKELVSLRPDAVLARTTPVTAALLAETRAIPIVFVNVSDPVGNGLVASLARPGGNVTGFTNVESSLGGKWLQLLQEVSPRVTRVAVLFNLKGVPGSGSFYLQLVEAAAGSVAVEVIRTTVQDAGEIERAIAAFAREPNGGLIVLPDVTTTTHRAPIIAAAARHRLPAVYAYRFAAADGGLVSYGVDVADLYRRAASYVDRILRGTKPSELPVQSPARFELLVNLKTAKALGLTIPQTLLARADEVIE